GLDHPGHQVRISGGGGLEPAQRDFDPSSVTAALERLDPFDLLRLERLVDLEELERPLLLLHVAVHADDDPLAALDLGLVAERRVGDLPLEEVLLDRLDDAAELLDSREVLVRLPLELVGQAL